MKAEQHQKPRWVRVGPPIGQSLVMHVPEGLDPELAERSVRRLLARQPITRFPSWQQVSALDGGRVAIRGLGHDVEDAMRFGREVEAEWRRVREERRDRRITLTLLALLALLVTVDAHASRGEKWDCHNLDGAEAQPVMTLWWITSGSTDDSIAGINLGTESIMAEYRLEGLFRRWGLLRQEGEGLGSNLKRSGRVVTLGPNGYAGYHDFNGVPEGEKADPLMIFQCKEDENWPNSLPSRTRSQPTEE